MSPYLFAQAVSVPLGLSDRATDAAERVLVDCMEPEDVALEYGISVAALRHAITLILRQTYRILSLRLPRSEEAADCHAAIAMEPAPRYSYNLA